MRLQEKPTALNENIQLLKLKPKLDLNPEPIQLLIQIEKKRKKARLKNR
jgi:hypothetical protein